MISFNAIKTVILLGALSGLILLIGNLLGGATGLHIALFMAIMMNGIAYFFSDKIVLRMYGAQQLDKRQYAHIYEMVDELAQDMNIPMPRLWLVKNPMANAFATGRNPQNGSIAVTTGILKILTPEELRGVLAHELSHIKNRDILVSTIAATLAATIGYLAQMLQYAAFWGSARGNGRRANPIVLLVVSMIMPIAALLIQLAISRSREFMADETGSAYSQDPLKLASALEKLQGHITHDNLDGAEAEYASTSSLFIVHPFTNRNWVTLFSTHPPIYKRVERLRAMAQRMR